MFVCAHELGHAVCHPHLNTPFLKAHTLFSTDKIEHEANAFAVELLMPDSIILEDDSIYNIAHCVGVPEQLVELKRI
jgi:Zn-dependent peptidase ImmA (M78 family)